MELSNLLLKEYTRILKTGEFYDIEVLVGEKANTKIFRLHSFVLKVCSPYFRDAFSNKKIKVENNIIKFNKPNISVKVFEILIKYIYSGKLELANNDVKTNIALLIAADELCLEELCSYIEDFLLINKELLKSNFVFVSHITNIFDQFTKLSQFCKDAFQEDPSVVLRADDFVTLNQERLFEYLTKDNDSLKQIEVWDKLIEWAIATSDDELPSDVSKWTEDNIKAFGTLIQRFIPIIDFQKMSRLDFMQKVNKFRRIFDNEHFIDIIEYFVCTDFSQLVDDTQLVDDIDSKIIDLRGASFIADRIKITKQQGRGITYHFNLLVRGSRDGFSKDTFHNLCDNKGPTVTIARVKSSNEILGGFNPCNWYSVSGFGDFISTKESFIFSLYNNNLENSIFSKVVDIEHAIYNSSGYGPCFGSGKSDLDLFSCNKKGRCVKTSYEKAIRRSEKYFEIIDYEVFQIIYNCIR
ncbi:hypothetical protein RhiirA4_549880 [Rhizophagus irregularis]|uniref:Kelch-like protein 17 n=1 Tax=Rhizophagus irregularis TaxID=588596 RepID=A0A2I1HGI8_9GLOM|nr:hypothetical protein RhiirA4_549880 [Rhizophagus irregularis]